MKALRAELTKLTSLPGVWIAVAIGLVLPAGVTVLNASNSRSVPSADTGFRELAIGVVAAIVIGVVAISSEYLAEGEESGGSRQITTSLTAVPSRSRFLLAKTAAVAGTVGLLALISSAITLTATDLTSADVSIGTSDLPRVLGIAAYWIFSALLAAGITLVTRSGIIPLSVLIVNISVVSVSFLLTKVTRLAYYFPDLAGTHLFLRDSDGPVDLTPVAGGLVMGLWVAVIAGIGAAAFVRRDA
ncbi:ABC transporter permease [Kribbella soli]|uniref:ABC transporter permease n=1 Tax=Kribbella soli TaxID=1124743 RepID=A0A4R0HG34_9ACTN|nr:ABC transporter permease [Kribbella soli]TCC07832.1 ABC transporter permease [Kribbella soli]